VPRQNHKSLIIRLKKIKHALTFLLFRFLYLILNSINPKKTLADLKIPASRHGLAFTILFIKTVE